MKRGRPAKLPEQRRRCCSITMSPEAWNQLGFFQREYFRGEKSRGAAIEWLIRRYSDYFDEAIVEDEQ